jgi:S1-C subfamily serine protease
VDVDGLPVADANDLQRLMAGELIGRSVTARLLRQGRELDVELVPDELTD